MGLNRREFLQRIGLTLTALGLSEGSLSLMADRYQQVLAQPTSRKLALLIGINQYSEQVCDYVPARGTALNGCLTDVALQQELLTHRFGFHPSDILTLTDQQATRQAIEEAFQSHLIQQARSGDVVIFHFSGLGSRIKLDGSTNEQNSLVPVDGTLPTADNPVIHDFLEETLGWLLRSLATEQVTTVLDTSYMTLGRTLQGNLRVRSRPNAPSGRIATAELELQEQLSQQTGTSREQIQKQWQTGQLPGVILAATRAHQVATEAQWNGFSAGLFTYALTQQLWWATPKTTLRFSMSQAISSVRQIAGTEQQPISTGQKLQQPILDSAISLPADGLIRSLDEEGRLQVWLAGLPAAILENYGASLLEVQPTLIQPFLEISDSGENKLTSPAPLLLQVRSRDGLVVKTRLISIENEFPVQVGQFVRERVRMLPRNIGLTVAIDASLERIERVDATSAFSAIPRVSSVIAGEQPADFLFGKTQLSPTLTASISPQVLTPAISASGPTDSEVSHPAPVNSSAKRGYGLFYPSRNAIPNTLIQDDEAVKTAVNRMTPQLRTLLAAKLLRLIENRGSSRLGVQATLEIVAPQERIVLQQQTLRAPWQMPEGKLARWLIGDSDLQVPLGSRIQYRLLNYSDRPVYFMLLGLDPTGNAIAFYPTATGSTLDAMIDGSAIAPADTVIVPQLTASSDWVVQTSGLAETHVILSHTPLSQAYQALATTLHSKTDMQRVTLLPNSLEVAQAILQDLHQASSAFLPKADIPADAYALDVTAWASFSFIYQVV